MNRTIILGLIGAVIVVLALLLNDFLAIDPPKKAEAPTEEASEAEDGTVEDASSTDKVAKSKPEQGAAETDSTSAGGATETEGTSPRQPEALAPDSENVAEAAAPSAAEKSPKPPSFDVVRISKEGDTVIAGRARPGTRVAILDGDTEIGVVEADQRGEWVHLPDAPLAPGSHELSLVMTVEDGIKVPSSDTVILVVPEPGKNVAGDETETSGNALAVLVPKDPEKSATRVLQKPSGKGVTAKGSDLAVDSVDYDDKGSVSVGGRGKPGTTVRTYLDNEPIGEATVDESGRWNVTPEEDVNEGVYSLRVDEVAEGEVVARLELPFSKSTPLLDFKGDNFVIVQPGNSLWRIARRVLGSGYSYTVIYEANKDQIRDPDLIYPGQIVEVPAN